MEAPGFLPFGNSLLKMPLIYRGPAVLDERHYLHSPCTYLYVQCMYMCMYVCILVAQRSEVLATNSSRFFQIENEKSNTGNRKRTNVISNRGNLKFETASMFRFDITNSNKKIYILPC